MTTLYLAGALVCGALLVYLVAALFNAEDL